MRVQGSAVWIQFLDYKVLLSTLGLSLTPAEIKVSYTGCPKTPRDMLATLAKPLCASLHPLIKCFLHYWSSFVKYFEINRRKALEWFKLWARLLPLLMLKYLMWQTFPLVFNKTTRGSRDYSVWVSVTHSSATKIINYISWSMVCWRIYYFILAKY